MLTSVLNGLVFLLVNGLVVFSSWCLASYLLKENQSLSLRVIATAILSFTHATIVVLFLGVVAHYLNYLSVSVFSGLVSLSLLALFYKNAASIRGPIQQALCELYRERDYFLYGMTALLIIQILVLFWKVIWLPPHVWDVFFYHLTPAVEWYQRGEIPAVLALPVEYIDKASLGMTVLAYWFFIFFRHDFIVEMPMLLWTLMLLPLTYTILRQSGVSVAWSVKFAIVVFFIPIVLLQAVTNKDHLGLNIGFITALMFMANFLRSRNYHFLILAALALGLMLGYKIAAPIHLFVATVSFFVYVLIGHRDLLLQRAQQLALLKSTVIGGILVALVGGYWLIRNIVLYGRPQGFVSPHRLDVDVSSKVVDTVVSTAPVSGDTIVTIVLGLVNRFNIDPLLANLAEFPARIFDYQFNYGTNLITISGYGPQFVAFGLLAIIALVASIKFKVFRIQPAFFIAVSAIFLLVLMMMINRNANSYRILSFFPMAMIAYAGVLLWSLKMLADKKGRLTVNVVMVLTIIWSMAHILPPQDTNLRLLKEFVALDADQRTSATFTRWSNRHRPDIYRQLAVFPADEPIALVAQRVSNFEREPKGQTWAYVYYDRNWQRDLVYLNQPDYIECNRQKVCRPKSALAETLKEKKVSLVSLCMNNHCLKLVSPYYFELVPGLYYFDRAGHDDKG